MKRLLTLLGALAMSVAFLLLGAPGARADSNNDTPSSWNFASYQVVAEPHADGTTKVTVDFDFDFASDPGHGPFLTFVTRMRVANDPDHWRTVTYDIQQVTSSTGANTETQLTTSSDGKVLRIGNARRTFTGRQHYQVVYVATGIINPKAPGSGLDEFNWNAIIAGDSPFHNVGVTVVGPVAATKTACFTGRSFTIACDASRAGSARSTFHVDRLTSGQGMQVVAGYPAGTFPGAKIQLTKRYNAGNMFPTTPGSLAAGGATAALGVVLVGAYVRRHGRDRSFIDLPPGMIPLKGDDAQRVGIAGKREIPVAFTPPKGISPGEIGVLIDERADNRDVTAGILDLAVRGHLQIQPDPNSRRNFTLARAVNPPAEPLRPYEASLLQRLFGGAMQVTNRDLAHKSNAGVLTQGKADLEQRTVQLGWFARKPSTTRALAFVLGVVVTLAGAGLAVALGFLGNGWIGIGVALSGLALVLTSGRMPSRTAVGSAALAQALGFRTYLATAEADQIKFEEGIDVFSRYLPYATVFGVADRWVKVFQELEARGIYHPTTTWYGGGYFWGNQFAFSQSMDAVTSAMNSSLQAAVTAASASSGSGGGSGFSGGGGVGGGSGGGW